jgi:copper chaperone
MATTQQTVLHVEGMSCQSCVRHVEGALRDLSGISRVTVRLREGEVVVEHDEAPISAMIEALLGAGYQARR